MTKINRAKLLQGLQDNGSLGLCVVDFIVAFYFSDIDISVDEELDTAWTDLKAEMKSVSCIEHK